MGWEIALAAISTGMSAAQQISAGRERKRQEEIRQRELKADQQRARIQALQEEIKTTKDFRATNARNIALAAAKGFDPTLSGSFLALEEDSEENLSQTIQNIKLFGAGRQATASNSILASKAAAKSAGTSAFFGAANTIFSGATQINKLS